MVCVCVCFCLIVDHLVVSLIQQVNEKLDVLISVETKHG